MSADPTGGMIVRTIVCPLCQQLPEHMFNPTQVICSTEGCAAFLFNTLLDPAEQVAGAYAVDLEQGGPAVPRTVTVLLEPDAAILESRRSDPDWARHAAHLRSMLHQWGYWCADGCPVCDPEVELTAGQRADAIRLVEAPRRRLTFPAVLDLAGMREELRPIAAWYGMPGLQAARDHLLTQIRE